MTNEMALERRFCCRLYYLETISLVAYTIYIRNNFEKVRKKMKKPPKTEWFFEEIFLIFLFTGLLPFLRHLFLLKECPYLPMVSHLL